MPSRRPTVNVRRITAKQASAYNHVRPNPGVRTIASINGRGSYQRNSARAEMLGVSPARKREIARKAVERVVGRAGMSPGRSSKRSTEMRRNRIRRRRSPRRNPWAEKKSGSRKVSFAPRHSSAAKKGWVTRRRKVGKKKAKPTASRKRRTSTAAVSAPRKVSKRRSSKRSKASKASKRTRARKTSRKSRKSSRKSSVARKKTAKKARLSQRPRHTSAKKKAAKKRTTRKSSRRRTAKKAAVKPNRRRRSSRRSAPRSNRSRRRSPRRNGRRSMFRNPFRKNSIAGVALDWLKTGAFIVSGVVAHKLLTATLENLLKSGGTVVTPSASAEAEAKAAAGLGFLPTSLAPYSKTISGGIVAAAGVYATLKFVKNAETRKLVAGGLVASFVHTLLVDLLAKNASTAKYAAQIQGVGSDATAARLSAMYGVGSSIQPMYAPIGEYFGSGVGEYFGSGVGAIQPYEAQAGMGEYFGSGIGAYESNPDIYQAAAGFGAIETSNTNHLNPASDLDRELSIAEAAAGVGNFGPFQAAAGLGNAGVSVLPATAQTWIPGESNPGVWAGVRKVDRSQMATAMVPAGILSSGGGAGVFG